LQKYRLQPSAALFRLARQNLEKYPLQHHQLDLMVVRQQIEFWLYQLEQGEFQINPLTPSRTPQLVLQR
jgi:hypothetical protein